MNNQERQQLLNLCREAFELWHTLAKNIHTANEPIEHRAWARYERRYGKYINKYGSPPVREDVPLGIV